MNGKLPQIAVLAAIAAVVCIGVIGASIVAIEGGPTAAQNTTQVLGFCGITSVALLGLLQSARNAEAAKIAADDVAKKQADDALAAKTAAELVAAKAEIAARKAEVAAVQVAEVKKTLQETTAATTDQLAGIAQVGKDTHTLVNSNMAAQLKISAVALRRLAEETHNKDDEAAATLAEKNLTAHEAKQRIVDHGSEPDSKEQKKAEGGAA